MMTPIDTAHAAMSLDAEDDAARLRFYGLVADSEWIVLVSETDGSVLTPQVFALEDGPVILAFDTEERLTALTGGPSPYAALPGRLVMAQLAGQGVGLGLNLGVAPSSILLPADVVDWLARTLASNPDLINSARPVRFHSVGDVSAGLVGLLEQALRRAAGLADSALLAVAEDDKGLLLPFLAFVDADPARQEALVRMISEVVAFDGKTEQMPDIVFLAGSDPILDQLAPAARCFKLPAPEPVAAIKSLAPGTDPNRPPILR
jgi:hypothetical protein